MARLTSVYAQDIITLKNGDEIKAKVEEISSTEVRYKRFENLQGPTIVVAKSDVFFINYENGRREVITPLEETPASKTTKMAETKATETQKTQKTPKVQETTRVQETPKVQRFYLDTIVLKTGEKIEAKEIQIFAKKIKYNRYENLDYSAREIENSKVSAIHYSNGTIIEATNNFRAKPNFGIFLNPGGGLTYGVMVGAEVSAGRFDIEAAFSFPQTGLIPALYRYGRSGANIDFLVSPKYYTNGIKGGFYIGPFVGYRNHFERNRWMEISNNGQGVLLGLNTGYKFVLPSGLYFRTGAYLGVSFNFRDGVYYYDRDHKKYQDYYGYYRYNDYDVYQYYSDKGYIYFSPFLVLDLTIGFNFLKVMR